jgi:hypothetical protein
VEVKGLDSTSLWPAAVIAAFVLPAIFLADDTVGADESFGDRKHPFAEKNLADRRRRVTHGSQRDSGL